MKELIEKLLNTAGKTCPEFGEVTFVFHQGQVGVIMVNDKTKVEIKGKK